MGDAEAALERLEAGAAGGVDVLVGCYEKHVLGYGPARAGVGAGAGAEPLRRRFAAEAHQAPVRCLATGGSFAASGGDDEEVCLFDLARGKAVGSLGEAGAGVRDLQFHRARGEGEPSHLFAAGAGGCLDVWHLGGRSIRHLRSLRAHKGGVNSVAVHCDGGVALSVGRERGLALWDLRAGRAAFRRKLGAEGLQVRFSPCGKLFCVRSDGGVAVHAVEDDTRRLDLVHDTRVLAMEQPSPDTILTGAEDGGLRAFDLRTGADSKPCWEVVGAHAARVKALAALPGAEIIANGLPGRVASACSQGVVRVWDTRAGGRQAPSGGKGKETANGGALLQAKPGVRVTCMAARDWPADHETELEFAAVELPKDPHAATPALPEDDSGDGEDDDFLGGEEGEEEAEGAEEVVLPRGARGQGKRTAGARGGRKKKMKAKDMKRHLANLDRFDD